MRRPPRASLGIAVIVASLAFVSAANARAEGALIAAHADGGFGIADVRPLTSPTSVGGTLSAGLSRPLRRRWRATLELSATRGGDFGAMAPEGPFSGDRTLTTLLLGLEASDARDARGPFAEGGVGLGHVTLSGATRSMIAIPSADWRYPDRNFVGLAFGGSAGYRTHGGPGPLGLQLAARYHAAAADGRVAASAFAITIGLAY